MLAAVIFIFIFFAYLLSAAFKNGMKRDQAKIFGKYPRDLRVWSSFMGKYVRESWEVLLWSMVKILVRIWEGITENRDLSDKKRGVSLSIRERNYYKGFIEICQKF